MAVRVAIMLGGADMIAEQRFSWAKAADILIGVDSGADRLLEAGLPIDLLIGDLDSASERGRSSARELAHIAEQESTDFEKCLRYCEAFHSESEFLVMGSEGDRHDQSVAVLAVAAQSNLNLAFAVRSGLAVPIRPGANLRLRPALGSTLSLLPLADCSSVSLTGVEWPLLNEPMHPITRVSISNKVNGPVELLMASGYAILYVNAPVGTWPSEILESPTAG